MKSDSMVDILYVVAKSMVLYCTTYTLRLVRRGGNGESRERVWCPALRTELPTDGRRPPITSGHPTLALRSKGISKVQYL